MVININKHGNLGGLDYFQFGYNIINLLPEVEKSGFISGELDKRKDIKVKSNVQSPGIVEFISHVPAIILGIGLVLTFLVGGKVNIKYTKEDKNVSAESEGLFKLLTDYKKQKTTGELEKMRLEHEQSMERVKAELPTELKSLPINKDLNDKKDQSV